MLVHELASADWMRCSKLIIVDLSLIFHSVGPNTLRPKQHSCLPLDEESPMFFHSSIFCERCMDDYGQTYTFTDLVDYLIPIAIRCGQSNSYRSKIIKCLYTLYKHVCSDAYLSLLRFWST